MTHTFQYHNIGESLAYYAPGSYALVGRETHEGYLAARTTNGTEFTDPNDAPRSPSLRYFRHPTQRTIAAYRRRTGVAVMRDISAWASSGRLVRTTGEALVAVGYVPMAWTDDHMPALKNMALPSHRHSRSNLVTWSPATGRGSYSGRELDPWDWRRLIQTRQAFGALVAGAIKAAKNADEDEAREQIDEVLRVSHNYNLFKLSRAVEAINEVTRDEGYDDLQIEEAGCGHLTFADTLVTTHTHETYCESCGEACREDYRGRLFHEDDLHYWESDGEYHNEEEPTDDDGDNDDDDDESGSNCDDIRTWGASTAGLSHDRLLVQNTFSDFTMGVELEVESSHRSKCEAAEDTLEQFNTGHSGKFGYLMLKADGSLSDNGFELVTAARRLDDHLKAFKDWKPHDSLRAWNPGNCGVHVHIDSRAFSGLTLGKFLMFINDRRNKEFIKSIAGRHPTDGGAAESYCAALDQEMINSPAKAIKAGHHSRYRMVNLCNLGSAECARLGVDVQRDCKGSYSTVELRIFRATLKKERLLAQIEFTHAAVMFCRTASWHALNGDNFKEWLTPQAGRYKHIARWLGINVPKPNTKTPAPVVEQLDETVAA
jgi:hypothetical protein